MLIKYLETKNEMTVTKTNFVEQIKSRDSYLLLEDRKTPSRNKSCSFYILYEAPTPSPQISI